MYKIRLFWQADSVRFQQTLLCIEITCSDTKITYANKFFLWSVKTYDNRVSVYNITLNSNLFLLHVHIKVNVSV